MLLGSCLLLVWSNFGSFSANRIPNNLEKSGENFRESSIDRYVESINDLLIEKEESRTGVKLTHHARVSIFSKFVLYKICLASIWVENQSVWSNIIQIKKRFI